MPGLPGADYRAVRLDRIDVATLNPDVLRLVDRLLNDDRRGSHDDRCRLHNDGRRRHDDWRRRHNGRRRRRRYCACDKSAEERAAYDARGNRAAAAVMMMVEQS